MKNILLVEDDPQISDLLHLHLQSLYEVDSCTKGAEAFEKIFHTAYDLIILDIMLPDMNGIQVCSQLRLQDCTAAILMLSSLSDETDKVLALELGADDYVTKPFSIFELLARTKALIRRKESRSPGPEAVFGVIRYKELAIDRNKKKAAVGGQRIDLTPKEFDLLVLLATHPGKSFTRHELLELIWGFAFQEYEHTVTAHINRLRIKIEKDLQKPEYILTSWGVGYRFAE